MVAFGLSGGVAECLLQLSRRLLDLLLCFLSFPFLLLVVLEPLSLALALDRLLLLFLARLLDLLVLRDLLRAKYLVCEEPDLEGEFLCLAIETLACLPCGDLDLALAEVLKGAVTGMLAVTAPPSDGGPGGVM